MKALTVQQPWAWAIVHAGKNIENRDWRPRKMPDLIAIHAGKTDDPWAWEFIERTAGKRWRPGDDVRGAIIGTAAVTDWHPRRLSGSAPWNATHCCRPWGMAGALYHVVLANVRPCDPIPCRGALGLWTVPAEIAERLGGDR